MDPANVEAWLGLWPGTGGGRATLVNLSENHTFRIDAPAGRFALRVHRPRYQSCRAIESELAWITALADELPVPRPVAGRDGALIQTIADARSAVLFEFEAGEQPSEGGDLLSLFATLGRYAAAAHEHATKWDRPLGFTRPAWTTEAILDADGPWGDWRGAPNVSGSVRAGLDTLDGRLRQSLSVFGQGPGRFGLIHADMRLANLLVQGGQVTLIDFDDCGFGWHLYDLAASLSFIETRPDVMRLVNAWIGGYRARRPLPEEDCSMIPPIVLLRRMALLAWIGSHGETDLARRHAPNFASDTLALVERLWP